MCVIDEEGEEDEEMLEDGVNRRKASLASL